MSRHGPYLRTVCSEDASEWDPNLSVPIVYYLTKPGRTDNKMKLVAGRL